MHTMGNITLQVAVLVLFKFGTVKIIETGQKRTVRAKRERFFGGSDQVCPEMVGHTGNFSLGIMVIRAGGLGDGDGFRILVL